MLPKLLKHYWRPFISINLIFTIVGISFIFTSKTSEQIKILADKELDQQWRTDYDLLVSTVQDQSKTIDKQEFIRRSNLGDLRGGISLSQYEQIKQIEGIEVAAPLSFLGYLQSPNSRFPYKLDEGLYIIDTETEVLDGIRYRNVPIDILTVSDIIFIM